MTATTQTNAGSYTPRIDYAQDRRLPPHHDGQEDDPAAQHRRCGPDGAGPLDAVPDERVAPEQDKAAGSRNGLGSRVDMGKIAEAFMAIGLPGAPEYRLSAN
jgi:hypothetical protein